MKKLLFLMMLFASTFSITGFVKAEEYTLENLLDDKRIIQEDTWLNMNNTEIVQYLYNNGMTIYNDFQKFRPYDGILRSEVTKFFVRFAEKKGFAQYKKSIDQCNFKDINQNLGDLYDTIRQSCVYGLFNGSSGKFNPYGKITKGEAITALVRMIDGKKYDESGKHFALKYLERLNELNINLPSLKYANIYTNQLNEPITRIDMGRLLEGAEFSSVKVKGVINSLNQ